MGLAPPEAFSAVVYVNQAVTDLWDLTGTSHQYDGVTAFAGYGFYVAYNAEWISVGGPAAGSQVVQLSCQCATAGALPSYTYNNASSGVGATITLNSAGVLTIDGYTPVLDDRILVANESGANEPYNGVYTLSTVGTVSVAAVLTRALDFQGAFVFESGYAVFVQNGTANAGTLWLCTTYGSGIIGTTNITFAEPFSSGGSGLTINYQTSSGGASVTGITTLDVPWKDVLYSVSASGTTFSIALRTQSANVGLFGPASGSGATPQFRFMVVADMVALAAAGSSHSAGIAPDPGGTAHSPFYVLGDDATWHAQTAITNVGTLTAGATGAGFTIALGTSTVSGILGITNGGTGVNSLTANAVVLGGSSAVGQVSGLGTAGQVLTSAGAGTPPVWQGISTGQLVGQMTVWPGRTAPSLWYFCQGQSMSRSTYSALFAVLCPTIGNPTFSNGSATITLTNTFSVGDTVFFETTNTLPTNFAADTVYFVVSASGSAITVSLTRGGSAIVAGSAGSGTHTCFACPFGLPASSPSTTFSLPNLSGSVPLGVGTSGQAGATAHTLGQVGGEETHVLTSPGELPAHTHGENTPALSSGGTYLIYPGVPTNSGSGSSNGGAGSYPATASTGSGGAHNTLPPYQGVNWIIYAGV